MSYSNQIKKKRGRKYPGFRPCLNHDTLSEMFKNEVPEICPSCFGSTARHQVQLVALNYASITRLRNAALVLHTELEAIKLFLKDNDEGGIEA